MYNTDNSFNFCFVYQLHFNRMKQNIDVYDFDERQILVKQNLRITVTVDKAHGYMSLSS